MEPEVASWLRACRHVLGAAGENVVSCGQGFQPEAAIEYPEKRRSPRYSFIASAELIEEKAEVRIAPRASELSLHGCYLDMMNPFPMGPMVLVKIAARAASVEASPKIISAAGNVKT